MSIEIHFKKGGRIQMSPKGYPGKMCHEATRPYEDAMKGGKVTVEGEDQVTHVVTATNQVKVNG